MGTLEIPGKSVAYLFWGVALVVFVPLVVAQLGPWDSAANLALGIFFLLLLAASAIGVWRAQAGREPEHVGTYDDDVYDVAKDPLAHHPYGGLAKSHWERAVERLPGNDDEDD